MEDQGRGSGGGNYIPGFLLACLRWRFLLELVRVGLGWVVFWVVVLYSTGDVMLV